MNGDRSQGLLSYRSNVYSQNGEDGIIRHIFEHIGVGSRISCEFGAWDGLHLSNCRNLILQGWRCIMIEGDKARYQKLRENYAGNPLVNPVNCFVDDRENSVDRILARLGVEELDFLSIDIDGLDYDILSSLSVRPRVICVEVNAGHRPDDMRQLPVEIARENIGQPLGVFVRKAEELGYGLVCYNGNAFLLRGDCLKAAGWSPLTAADAYESFLDSASSVEREWLYLVNLGKVPPFHAYRNDRLAAGRLGISASRAAFLRVKARGYVLLRGLKRAFSASW